MPDPRRNQFSDTWDGVDRRYYPPDSPVTHAELDDRLASGRAAMTKHFDDRFDALEALIKSGFPYGDPIKHREAHEGQIADAQNNIRLWQAVKEKTITGGVYAGLGFILLAVWDAVKAGLHK